VIFPPAPTQVEALLRAERREEALALLEDLQTQDDAADRWRFDAAFAAAFLATLQRRASDQDALDVLALRGPAFGWKDLHQLFFRFLEDYDATVPLPLMERCFLQVLP